MSIVTSLIFNDLTAGEVSSRKEGKALRTREGLIKVKGQWNRKYWCMILGPLLPLLHEVSRRKGTLHEVSEVK